MKIDTNHSASTYQAQQERLKAMFHLPENAEDVTMLTVEIKQGFYAGFYKHIITYNLLKIIDFLDWRGQPQSRLVKMGYQIQVEPTKGRIIL